MSGLMINILHLALAIIVPLGGGWASSIAMAGEIRKPGEKAWYQIIKKPSWTPRNEVFAPVWVVLYSTMGVASYLVYLSCYDNLDKAVLPLALYAGQLALNFMWTPIFFGLHWIKEAFFEMLLLDVTTLACTYIFYQTSVAAALLMTPYLAWLAFASCLNCTIWRMNPDEQTVKAR